MGLKGIEPFSSGLEPDITASELQTLAVYFSMTIGTQ